MHAELAAADLIAIVRAIGRRAAEAAAAGAPTFPVPELGGVADAIAGDPRARRAAARALRWRDEGASYHALVRACGAYVLEIEALTPDPAPMYVPKARDELEPLLALSPDVLALPTTRPIPVRDLLRLRAFPVHPLGVVAAPAWADGRLCSPAEYFFHDLDHARFKVREDLVAAGIALPDAYSGGTTLDPASGRHRVILAAASRDVGPWLWSSAPSRLACVDAMLASIDALAERPLARAAVWLLFQTIHEKSLPIDAPTLRRALSTTRHVALLQGKIDRGFYADDTPPLEVVGRLDAARAWLSEALP